MNSLYKIKDWDACFENNKSRERDSCSWCPIPNKQDGLGYGLIMLEDDGPAIYGAFVAVVLMHSKTSKPRDGHLTDTGKADGRPLGASEISVKTRMPVKIVKRMLDVICCDSIGWIQVANEVPAKCPPKALEGKGREGKRRESFCPEPQGDSKPSKPILSFPCTGTEGAYHLTEEKLKEYQTTFETIDVLQSLKVAKQWLHDNPTRKKTARGMPKFMLSWLARDANNPSVPKRAASKTAEPRSDEADPAKMFRDWDSIGVETFKNRHGIAHEDFAKTLRIDLADLGSGAFSKKYKMRPGVVRDVLAAWSY